MNIEHISKLRWVLEKRNILDIDNIAYSITSRDAIHVFSGQKIDKNFIQCKLNGKTSWTEQSHTRDFL